MKRFLAFILFAAKCCAICGGTLLLLFLLNGRYEQVMDNPYSDADKFLFMDSSYNNIQICNLGSSHGEYAFNYEKLSENSGFECFNFAMASQTFNYDQAILSMYQNHFAEDCIMFIPVSYFSFNNEVVNEEEEEFLNAKYYSFLSPEYIPHYSPYVDVVAHRLPILSASEDIVKVLPSLSLRSLAAGEASDRGDNSTGNENLSADETAGADGLLSANEASAGSNPPAEEASDAGGSPSAKEFEQKALDRYRRHMENKEEYFLQERIDNLYGILDFCKTNGITPVLITTPYTAYYYGQAPAEFKEEFSRVITAIAAGSSVPYYDYSEDSRFGNRLEYFSDADHLNEKGADLFMDIIKQEIPEFKDFLLRNSINCIESYCF